MCVLMSIKEDINLRNRSITAEKIHNQEEEKKRKKQERKNKKTKSLQTSNNPSYQVLPHSPLNPKFHLNNQVLPRRIPPDNPH